MKKPALLDTSVLTAAFYPTHKEHEASFSLFEKLDRSSGLVAAHSLAEIYANLTGMPGKLRTSADEALMFLDLVRERCRVVALEADDYVKAINALADIGITGGGVYDGLLAHCAMKAGAGVIYTWNIKDFTRLGPDIAARVKTPPDA